MVRNSSTLALSAKVKALKAAGEDVINFSIGEPDFPTPENIRKEGVNAIVQGQTRYTAVAGTLSLREAICRKFARFNHLMYTPEQIVVSSGGKHSLWNAFQAVLNPGDAVIIPAPYWLTYPEAVRLAGGRPVIADCPAEDDYKLTPENLEAHITPETRALVLNTPVNPTGGVYSRRELEALAEVVVRHDLWVISDEMYEELTYDGIPHVSIASVSPDMYERTITVCGMSKSYAMTGWRIGYTGSCRRAAEVMVRIQSHETSNANSIAQAAAAAGLNGSREAVEEMKKAFAERRAYIYQRAAAMPYIRTNRPQGAFYLFINAADTFGRHYEGREIRSAADFSEILLEHRKTAVMPCRDFGAPDAFRISYAVSMEDIRRGMNRMEQLLKELN